MWINVKTPTNVGIFTFMSTKLRWDWKKKFYNLEASSLESSLLAHISSPGAVKPVLSGHSKITKTKVLKTNGSLMTVESIAECPKSILQYFWPALSDKRSSKTILVFFVNGRLRQVYCRCKSIFCRMSRRWEVPLSCGTAKLIIFSLKGVWTLMSKTFWHFERTPGVEGIQDTEYLLA